jgi:hypothetical protein
VTNRQLILTGLGHALGVLVYTSVVAWILFNGQRILGRVQSFWGPLALLLLFVLSATVVGLLVPGRPGYLYFNGAKREGIVLLLATAAWLFFITASVFLAHLMGAVA